MRKFTEQEKWILKKIVEVKVEKNVHSISLEDICVLFLDHEYIKITLNKEPNIYNIEFYFDLNEYNPINELAKEVKKQNEIERKIIDTVFLLTFLKEKGLLFEIKGYNDDFEFEITKYDYDTNSHYIRSCNYDKDLEQYLVNSYVNRQYCIRQEFINFVQNNYKTTEDIRYRKGVWLTWLGIIIAFLIGLTSVIISIKQKNNVEFDKEQLNHFDSCLNKIIDSKEKINLKNTLFDLKIIDKFDTLIRST
jgi:hypothetical protein